MLKHDWTWFNGFSVDEEQVIQLQDLTFNQKEKYEKSLVT